MIRTLDLRGQALSKAGYQRAIPRASLDIATAMRAIEPILDRVKNGPVNSHRFRTLYLSNP